MSAPARRALDGTRVVEWGSGRALAYAGRQLADHGAGVVLIERDAASRTAPIAPPPGASHDCELEARVRWLHGGKRSATCDPRDPAQREQLLALFGRADVLLLEGNIAELDALGLSPESLSERFPALVVVPITLAGLGSGRSLRSSDLVATAMSGLAFYTGATVPTLEDNPPLRPGGYQAEYTAGLAAATGALVGLQLRRRSGRGSLVDTSLQASLASFMRMTVAYRLYEGADVMGLGIFDRLAPTGKRSTLWGMVPCKDGYFAFQASEQWQWDGLMDMMGDPEWAKAPEFELPIDRTIRWAEIEPHFVGWCLEHTKKEIFHEAQARHVPVFPCYDVAELIADEQQQARAYFVDLPVDGHLVKVPGAVLHLDKTPWIHDNEPPAPGQHTAEVFAEITEVGHAAPA
ncbi:MAG: CoA transferase [Dehalococcoidia bacterium]|nr:CoA transferase [Dehalococcoidia bacterium]